MQFAYTAIIIAASGAPHLPGQRYLVAQSAVHRYSTIRYTVLKVLSIPLLAVSLSASAGAQAQSIQLYIQEFGLFTHTDPQSGEIRGFLTEKVAEIMKRSKNTGVHQYLTGARTECCAD
jgi:hypothetical protein